MTAEITGSARPSRFTWSLLGLSIALVHGTLWWIYYVPATKLLWGDENTYRQSAVALLAGDPGWWPDPLWPPLYPQFLAGLMAVGGGRLLLVQLAQILLLVLSALLMADVVRAVSGSRAAGFVAGGLVVVYPPLVGFALFLWPEVLHFFLFLAVLWILVRRNPSWPWCVVGGVAMGLGLLTKSLLGPFLPILLVAAFARRPVWPNLARAAVFAVAVVLTVAPTVRHQHARTGRWMIADSSAFNLWVGINDVARRNFEVDVVTGAYHQWVQSGATFAERDDAQRERIKEHLAGRSWWPVVSGQLSRQYFRLFDKDSYLTDQLPGGAAVESYGAGYVGMGPTAARLVRGGTILIYAVLLAAAPLGFAAWRFRDRRWLRVLLLFVVYNLAIFFWLHVKTRFRVQMLPVLFTGAGSIVAWFGSWVEGDSAMNPVPRWRWAVGFGVAALLEFLAFAGPWLP